MFKIMTEICTIWAIEVRNVLELENGPLALRQFSKSNLPVRLGALDGTTMLV